MSLAQQAELSKSLCQLSNCITKRRSTRSTKNFEKWLLSLIFLIASQGNAIAQEQLLPMPQKIEKNSGSFAKKTFNFQSSDPIKIQELISSLHLPQSKTGAIIELDLVGELPQLEQNVNEGYILTISPDKVLIQAVDKTGLYRALQTFKQLLDEYPKAAIPCMRITDWPSFRVRGLMMDVGRSYISVEEIKRQIVQLAKYKINVYHWHLTENQAWRLESKKHPKLTAAKNMTRMAGKFYTHEEAKEIQALCEKHQITLIPEFDMPGHSKAFVRAFGVDMQSAKGMIILKELMDEVCKVFDRVPYIHIGTDEVRITNPKFCDEMVAYLRARGKKVISWAPGWHYKKGGIDMTQMWSYRGRPTKGVPVIDSRYHYINHYDTFADIVGLYTSRIASVAKGSHQHAGCIIAIWNDRYIPNEQDNMKQNQLYPSMLAMAERAWLGGGWQYYDKEGTNLIEGTPSFEAFKNFEERLIWHKNHNFKGYPFGYVKQCDVKWNISDPFPNNGKLDTVFEPEVTLKDEYILDDKKITVREAIGSGIYLRHVWGPLIPSFYKNPPTNHTAYAWTHVYSAKKQTVGLWFETQNYSRSEKDLGPKQGTWDYKCSKIWINENEIAPPKWTSTHSKKNSEIPLGNENMLARDPISITLNKGWNKVLIKLPNGGFSSNHVRLIKWMFAAAFVNKDGTRRIEGLIYSPDKQLPTK